MVLDSNAGAKERIGFIEAPDIGLKKNTSREIIAAIEVLIIIFDNFSSSIRLLTNNYE